MKLISLNVWRGRIFDPLIRFTKQHSLNTDIFCFQEMQDTNSNVKQYKGIRTNLLSEIKSILPQFQIYHFPSAGGFDNNADPVNFDLTFGITIFIKNSIKVSKNENYFVNKKSDHKNLQKDFSNLPVPLQYINFYFEDKSFSLFNFHGIPFPGNKLDTNERLADTKKVKEIINSKPGAKILVGDFNLLPETQSIKIFESYLKNLIKEYKIQRTRSKLSPFFGMKGFQKFADYIFVSRDINIKNFEVPRVDISDHLPLILEFS